MAFNVFDRSVAPLGEDATYTGEWQDMQQYAAIAAVVAGDQIISAARFEWSDDASTVKATQPWITAQNPISYGGSISAATPTQSKFVRLVVVNGGSAQGPTWSVQTALLDEVPGGYVAPLVDFPRDADPGETVRAVMYGRRIGDVDPQYTHILVDDGGAVVTSPGPNPTTATRNLVPVDTAPQQLDFGIFGLQRKGLTVLNDSVVSTLLIKLGFAPFDVTDYDYEVPPGHTWTLPTRRVPYGDSIFGIWDVSDPEGFARVMEIS